ncbi:MAG: SPOR domain-containing protein [Candidatus Omnitrophota bacterium]
MNENKQKRRHFFSRTETRHFTMSVSLDSLLLFTLLFVMGFVIVYAIGVEKGRQGRRNSVNALAPAAVMKKLPAASLQKAPVPAAQEKEIAPSATQQDRPEKRFTIQVASFENTATATEALEKMKRGKGIVDGFLISGSKHVAVCIGTYEKRAEADRALEQLRKSYGDAFVRNR